MVSRKDFKKYVPTEIVLEDAVYIYIDLRAGESRNVSTKINLERVAYRPHEKDWVVMRGEEEVLSRKLTDYKITYLALQIDEKKFEREKYEKICNEKSVLFNLVTKEWVYANHLVMEPPIQSKMDEHLVDIFESRIGKKHPTLRKKHRRDIALAVFGNVMSNN